MRTAFVLLLTFALYPVFVGVAAPARAQEGGEYAQAIKLGSSEFEAANYAEARAQFTRAHGLFPNARTLRALGMVAFELKNYGECIEYLKSALTAQTRALEPSQRREAEQLLARARGYVARVSVDVEPAVATVLMDGVPVTLDEGHTLIVQVGDHMLEFRAPGRLAEKRLVKVSGGEERTLHVVLPIPEAAPASGAKAPRAADSEPAHAPSERTPLYKKAWLWVVIGVVVAGAAAGTAVALTRDKRRGNSADDDPQNPTLMAP